MTPNKAKELFTAVDLAVVAHVSYYPGVSVENLKELIKKEENEIAEEDIEKSIDVLLELDILKKIGQEKNYSLFIPEGMVYRNIFRALYGLGNVGIIHKILIKIKEYHGALYAETLAKELDVDFSRLHPYLEALNKYQIVTINGEGPRGWVKMNLKKLLAMQDRFDDGKKDFKDYFRLKLSLLCGVPYKRVYMRGGANFTFFTVRGGKITICTNPIRAYDWLPAKGTRLWHY